jgi:LacI family transcriptional regulator
MRPPRAATLKEVAATAGVHISTASRALDPSKRHLLGEEVIDRVVAAARQLDYRPNSLAASLRTQRSRLVGVLLPDISNSVFSPIFGGVSEGLAAAGYAVVVAEVGNDSEQQSRLFDELLARRVDGLILATARRDDPLVAQTIEHQVPAVLVNRSESTNRIPSAVSDDADGMRLAVEHLVSLGHRRIGHVAGAQHLSTGYLRRRGFEDGMAAHRLEPAGITLTGAYSREEGRAATEKLVDLAPNMTAIVAANDLLAIGGYEALRARGLSCPADISIVGHNDMPLVDMINPPLTTIHIRHRTLGREAARLLLRRIGNPEAPVQNVVLRPELIVRRSTSVCRQRSPAAHD